MKTKTTKQQKSRAFSRTMTQARSHLNPIARAFSVFIHLPPVDQVSRAIGATLARPLALLGGAIGMIVVTAIMYTTAKTIGYTFSGSEGLFGFGLGWLIGLIISLIYALTTSRRVR